MATAYYEWSPLIVFLVYLYVFGVFDVDIGIVAWYGLVDCLNLLPKETFTLVFDPYSLLQSNGQSNISIEAIVINNCIKLDMWRHHLHLLLHQRRSWTALFCVASHREDWLRSLRNIQEILMLHSLAQSLSFWPISRRFIIVVGGVWSVRCIVGMRK